MSLRYSGRQLVLARCTLVVLVASIAGPALADTPAEVPVTIAVVLALVGTALGLYEALSRVLAIALGQLWNDSRTVSRDQPATDAPLNGGLRRRDVGTALLIFFGAEALVWLVVGVIAAVRAGSGDDHAALLRALSDFLPIALPGSLLAGGIALALVLRKWRRKLGPRRLAQLIGLSWAGHRQLSNGALAGAALALFVLPLMGLVADPAEPPDVMTQLAGSSAAALRAWMLSAVLLAPPIEELMFRGVLLGGLAQTWNLRSAAVVSGITFWLMHGPEFIHWPAAVAIALLTALATWLRIRTGSLVSSIGAHFGYNLVLAAVVWVAMSYGTDKTRWARDLQREPIRAALRVDANSYGNGMQGMP